MTSVAEARIGAAIFITDDPAILRSTEFPNPGVVITPKEAKKVMSYVTKTPEPKASISFLETHLDSKPAPVVSASSARGPSRSYLREAKPDILAPGVLILAAYPSNIAAAKIGSNIELATDYFLESGDAEQEVQSGSITWVEENGNHTVRSPIVISPEIEVW